MLRQAPADYGHLRFSPDGRRLALTVFEGNGQNDVWIYDWATDALNRLTFDRKSSNPVWTPDGRRVVFASAQDNTRPIVCGLDP